MGIRRGQVYSADLGEPRGSGPGLARPVVVIQDNDLNDARIHTVIIAVVTTNLRLAAMDGNVLLTPRRNGVQKYSVVNVTQLYTVDKTELVELIGTVTKAELNDIDKGLLRVLSLDNKLNRNYESK
ncbi:MAG: type II toxin-antitoxin system PemK/MazF family toxin [Chloracidobacterium sp.]|nr:type II toxin-antitoxin system PemK/MazF family toxin [Chloracidobacterium sp.]MCC6825531.1 type II toxin-antitoxin system PemK/MazF family toxin [Acidobacteriota bacterium]MCO5333499.1 type II toxin-antitoxin system PemK/MazF family toxin [Pyrinomonadaceae bacterium]